jgi:hypothetical protein
MQRRDWILALSLRRKGRHCTCSNATFLEQLSVIEVTL